MFRPPSLRFTATINTLYPATRGCPSTSTRRWRWTDAFDAATRDPCHVPAAMVYIPYVYAEGSGDSPIIQPISTGLACHCSLEEAAVNAVCEVIERDAVMISWQARLAAPQIRIGSLSRENYDRVQRIERAGYTVTLLLITLDAGIPTVLAVSRHDALEAPPSWWLGRRPWTLSRPFAKAWRSSTILRRYSQAIKTHVPRLERDPSYRNIGTQINHLNFWCDRANASLAKFLFASQARVDFDDIENLSTGHPASDLEMLHQAGRPINHRILLADVTTPDVGQLGLVVVRNYSWFSSLLRWTCHPCSGWPSTLEGPATAGLPWNHA